MSWDLGVIRPVVIVIIGALVSGGVGASGYVVCVVRGPGGSIVHLVVVAPANLQTIASQRREHNGLLLVKATRQDRYTAAACQHHYSFSWFQSNDIPQRAAASDCTSVQNTRGVSRTATEVTAEAGVRTYAVA